MNEPYRTLTEVFRMHYDVLLKITKAALTKAALTKVPFTKAAPTTSIKAVKINKAMLKTAAEVTVSVVGKAMNILQEIIYKYFNLYREPIEKQAANCLTRYA
ncbi:46116_t:CDS:2 [Gigaspora margarita]|uniref:46116_t:CDS:1 n=1 Tax=Gigaspora margarita TaxID=4874 RepID=A0ABN7USR9_GIGMA|nr:46116_t:CDS:2 [Gigaspora margarita]